MPTPKLKIGSGLVRAKRNRKQPRDWNSVSGANLAANPALARRYARATKAIRQSKPLPPKNPIRKITFEDKGQDFLWWNIDGSGRVVDCGPFQASVWCQCTALNYKYLAVGVYPYLRMPDKTYLTLNYKITDISP